MRMRTFLWFLLLSATASAARAQTSVYQPHRARKHFISVSYDWHHTTALDFGNHPLADLLGRPVSEAHLQPYDYNTRDGATEVHVLEFSHPGQGASVTLYPLGLSSGAALTVRGSVLQLPTIRLAFDGPAPAPSYSLTGGRAYDLGAGVTAGDLSPGWGLGSYAFVIGGVGHATSDQTSGRRYFAEVGGAISSGPFGVELAVKYSQTSLSTPVQHRVVSIPVTVRAMVTF
jgi:hypothetical protein